MKIENFYNESNFIIDIISAIIISIQSFSFGMFFKRDNFVEAYIKSHLLYVYSGILIVVAEVFLKIVFIIDLFAYFSFIIGLINILSRILHNRSETKLIWQSMFYKGVPFLVLFLLIIYIRLAKDITYVSWDYLSFYYPNAIRLIDQFLIVPELYLPVFLYGAPLVATEALSYAILPNTFGAPIFYTISLIILIMYILQFDFNSTVFVLFNIIIFIYFVSFIGYLETPVLFYLLSFLQFLQAPKSKEGIFFALLVWIVFILKPYIVFAVIFSIIYIIFEKIIPVKSTLLKKLLMIPVLFIAVYLLIVQSLTSGIIVTNTLDYIIMTIIITIFIIMLFKNNNININIKFKIKDMLIMIPFILLFVYIYTVDMLYGLVVLPSSEFNMRLSEWITPIHNNTSNYYIEFYLIILIILLENFVIYLISFYRFILNNTVDRVIEIIILIGLSFSLIVILNYFPREFIRRIITFYFFMLLFTAKRLSRHIQWPINFYNISIIILSLLNYYSVEISRSWLEINLLQSINIYIYSLINICLLIMTFFSNKSNSYYRFLQYFEKLIFLLLILGIFVILHSLAYIPLSRELNYYLSINGAILTNNLNYLNNTSVLTCGFYFNKLFRLNSYDVASLSGYLLLYSAIYHNFSLTNYGINSIVILQTPLGTYCNLFFNNSTLQFFPGVKFLKIP